MCDQPRKVKIVLEKNLAEKLNLAQEWILGKVLPGQREGAAEWFSEFEEHFEDREDGPMHGSSYGLDQPDQDSGHFGPRG